MLDPLTALSLASAIVQFVDFGIKLVSEGVELYEKGSLTDHDELELATEDLTKLSGNIIITTRRGQGHAVAATSRLSKEEDALLKLASSCEDIGRQLLHLLEGLKVPKSNHTLENRLASLRQAIRSARKKDQIYGLEKRLSRMQSQLSIHILTLLRHLQFL